MPLTSIQVPQITLTDKTVDNFISALFSPGSVYVVHRVLTKKIKAQYKRKITVTPHPTYKAAAENVIRVLLDTDINVIEAHSSQDITYFAKIIINRILDFDAVAREWLQSLYIYIYIDIDI